MGRGDAGHGALGGAAGRATDTHRDRPAPPGVGVVDGRDGGDTWDLATRVDGSTPDVTVTTSVDAWTRHLTTPPHDRPATPSGGEITGTSGEIQRFTQLLARFPDAAG